MTISDLSRPGFIIFDGALGTMLQQNGMKPGETPMDMNLRASETVKMVHELYLKAGSNIIASNTFSASELMGKGKDVSGGFTNAITLAKAAAQPFGALVAADIGPIGRLLVPMGNLTVDEAYEIFKAQCILAEKAGADIIYFETLTDILETKVGVLAAKEATSLPVFASMSFEASGRTFLGCSLGAMALTLQAAGVSALGINCSVGPAEALSMAQELVKWTDLPIIIQPNAGLPKNLDGKTVYDVTADEFAELMAKLPETGVTMLGGCCGTSPEFIAALIKALEGVTVGQRPAANTAAVCSSSVIVKNPEEADVDLSLDCRVFREAKTAFSDTDELTDIVMDCEDDLFMLCADGAEGDELELLKAAVTELQSIVRVPFKIESENKEIIDKIDRYYRGKL